jgi:hypothetical protein
LEKERAEQNHAFAIVKSLASDGEPLRAGLCVALLLQGGVHEVKPRDNPSRLWQGRSLPIY